MIKHLRYHPKHPLAFLRGKQWSEYYRVRLPQPLHGFAKTKWCRENLSRDAWGSSEGQEVYYFVNLDDAVAFRLRWEGAAS